MKAALRWLGLVVFASALTVACDDDTGGVTVGMSERQVIRRLGDPSSVVTHKQAMAGFFFDDDEKNCLPKAKKVFVYYRWFSLDLGVALDSEGTVVCFQAALY